MAQCFQCFTDSVNNILRLDWKARPTVATDICLYIFIRHMGSTK